MPKPRHPMHQPDLFGEMRDPNAGRNGLMAQRFIVPPFSVLDARQGYWQQRKRAWLDLGIKSELGRGQDNLHMAHPDTTGNIDFYARKRRLEEEVGRELTLAEARALQPDLLDPRAENRKRLEDGTGLLGESKQTEDYRQNRGDYSKAGAVGDNGTGGMTKELMRRRGYGPLTPGQGANEAGLNYYRELEEQKAHSAIPGGAGAGSVYTSGSAWAGARNGKRATGLLGFSEQAAEAGLNHYRNGNGSNGNGPARKFGQDLMRGEHVVGQNGNGNGKATSTEARLSMGWTAHAYDDGGPGGEVSQSGTSIFDPVLCELVYRWFSPPAGHVLDPFAGGSVRGIVAAVLGRAYTGVDLSERQIAANRAQVPDICPDNAPRWLVGDSREIGTLAGPERYDLIFTCPPYGDLEVYSDHPADLSTMGHEGFLAAYREIIAGAVALLKSNRFAAFVVGDIRDRAGYYRSLPADTVRAFEAAGARFYNEAVLVTAVGSLPIRVGKQFVGARKLGKTHQNVLIFVKGDPKRAAAACELDMEIAGA